MTHPTHPRLDVRPLTPERWPDLEALFGPRGACSGCWCMWWRQTGAQFSASRGEKNRRALRALVAGGAVPGLLAYEGDTPVGWCAVEPRERYARLSRSRVLAPVDEAPVWSVTCFFVARSHRGKGVTRTLLEAAVDHARRGGARLLEAYPVDPAGRAAATSIYTGVVSTFASAGFEEVARRAPRRPIFRRAIRRRASREGG